MKDYGKIKLVVLDVDGTLTDGGIYYDSQGNEIKRFDVKDGLGIKVAMKAGLQFLVLTGRESCMVQRRIEELGIHNLVEGVQQKLSVLSLFLKRNELDFENVYYIGDDWNDLQCIQKAGFSACPIDAAEEVKNSCDYILKSKGGHGAVREGLKYLLDLRGEWEKSACNIYFD